MHSDNASPKTKERYLDYLRLREERRDKDKREDAVKWLERNGNAFIESGHDPEGEVARKFGIYGVPETFVIDRNGRIVHRHTGPISVREWAHVFRPLVQRLQSESD